VQLALILASGSSIRRKMLEDAGVEHIAARPDVDEAALKAGRSNASEIAIELAKAKALAVSSLRPGEWVIGSDSIVSVADRLFDKPRDREEAAEHLGFFSGKPLILTSAVALARDRAIDWTHVESAKLAVRPLSEAFIESYLQAEWPEVGYCVGVFRMEGRGVQLFDRMEGNHFTILGMPLISLLGALRERAILPS
jgi:septum formation protein